VNEIYDGPSRFTGEIATAKYEESAAVRIPESGRIVRGRVVQSHEAGIVTIEWGGRRITGSPIAVSAA
jgi:hypothetical protein